MIDIQNLQLKDLLPSSLKSDPSIVAICEAAQEQFNQITAALMSVLFIPNIQNQPEEVLQHLAWGRNLEAEEGWELSDSEEQKIELILNAYEIQRYKGTRFAIIRSLELLGINAEFQKWTEYGGDPYHFKIIINRDTAFSAEQLRLVERYISKTQSERDVGTIEITFNTDSPFYFCAGVVSDFTNETKPLQRGKQFMAIGAFIESVSVPPSLITQKQYMAAGCHIEINLIPSLLN